MIDTLHHHVVDTLQLLRIRDAAAPLSQWWQATLLFSATFLGSFFAFLFGRLGDRVDRSRERWRRHYDTLVRFEAYCDEALTKIQYNRSLLEYFTKVHSDQPAGPWASWILPYPLPLPDARHDNLLSLDLQRQIARVAMQVRMFNYSTDTAMRTGENLHADWIAGRVDTSIYDSLVRPTGEQLRKAVLVQENLFDDVISLLVDIRLLLRKDKHVATQSWRRFRSQPIPSQITAEEREQERTVARGGSEGNLHEAAQTSSTA